ncbi:MAG: glycoside hydrolase family 3 N-terminal domain-containing protein [Bacilli bacterium]
MDKRKWVYAIIALIIIIITGLLLSRTVPKNKNKDKDQTVENDNQKLRAMVLANSDNKLTVQDNNNIIYTFDEDISDLEVGTDVIIEYEGVLNKSTEKQNAEIINWKSVASQDDNAGVPINWQDNGIFKDYYKLASQKLKTLTLDEKISQLLLVRYPDTGAKNILNKYQFGGYIFFAKDFKDKSESEVKKMMKELQDVSKIPILTAVDEEGGKVVRVSSNPKLAKEPFKSSQDLYNLGGFERIKDDTISKSKILYNLGLNLNLAPVVDVSTNPDDYIYARSFGHNTELTSTYAKTVIDASKNTGVSYTLKHFPGYASNLDTHNTNSTDDRNYDDIVKNDLPPFKAGIDAGAEAVLVSHNTVTSIDSNNPASLSPSVHNLLRNDLDFTGIIITDSLDMAAITSIPDSVVKALLAGNDLLIVTDYENSFNAIKKAVNDNVLSENFIDKQAFRILTWKYYKGMMIDNQK